MFFAKCIRGSIFGDNIIYVKINLNVNSDIKDTASVSVKNEAQF